MSNDSGILTNLEDLFFLMSFVDPDKPGMMSVVATCFSNMIATVFFYLRCLPCQKPTVYKVSDAKKSKSGKHITHCFYLYAQRLDVETGTTKQPLKSAVMSSGPAPMKSLSLSPSHSAGNLMKQASMPSGKFTSVLHQQNKSETSLGRSVGKSDGDVARGGKLTHSESSTPPPGKAGTSQSVGTMTRSASRRTIDRSDRSTETTPSTSDRSLGKLTKPSKTTEIVEPVGLKKQNAKNEVSKTSNNKNQTTMNTLSDPKVRVVAKPLYLKLDSASFIVENLISEGSEGTVHKGLLTKKFIDENPSFADRVAHFTRNPQGLVQVAIKIAKIEKNQMVLPTEVKDRFDQEVSIWSALQGASNIVELVGYSDDSVLAIVMKYYYTNLKTLIEADKDIEVLPLFEFTADIGCAIFEMHNSGIIHCDLKSANILVDEDKARKCGMKLVIADFGVSQVLSAHDHVHARPIVIVGAASFPYAAPEILDTFFNDPVSDSTHNLNDTKSDTVTTVDNHKDGDPSRDMYSAGIIIWEMLSRQQAWAGFKPNAIYSAVCIKRQRPPVPFNYNQALNDRMIRSWRRSEVKFGQTAISFLVRIMELCWEQNMEDRLSASKLLDWFDDEQAKTGLTRKLVK